MNHAFTVTGLFFFQVGGKSIPPKRYKSKSKKCLAADAREAGTQNGLVRQRIGMRGRRKSQGCMYRWMDAYLACGKNHDTESNVHIVVSSFTLLEHLLELVQVGILETASFF